MSKFERVLRIDDWYDGPRSGVALYLGVPHAFRSSMLDMIEYKDDYETVDMFELKPLDETINAPSLFATATFRPAPGEAGSDLEVAWNLGGSKQA